MPTLAARARQTCCCCTRCSVGRGWHSHPWDRLWGWQGWAGAGAAPHGCQGDRAAVPVAGGHTHLPGGLLAQGASVRGSGVQGVTLGGGGVQGWDWGQEWDGAGWE